MNEEHTTKREMHEYAIGILGDFLDPNRRSELMYQLLRDVGQRVASHPEIQELLKRLDSTREGNAVLQTAKAILDKAKKLAEMEKYSRGVSTKSDS